MIISLKIFFVIFLICAAALGICRHPFAEPLFSSTVSKNQTNVAPDRIEHTQTETAEQPGLLRSSTTKFARANSTYPIVTAPKVAQTDAPTISSVVLAIPSRNASFADTRKEEPQLIGKIVDLPPEYRVCRINNPPPKFHSAPPKLANINLKMEYQCTGEPYDDYIQMRQNPFVMQKRVSNPGTKWGTRKSILPQTYNATTKDILVLGNSHTRVSLFISWPKCCAISLLEVS